MIVKGSFLNEEQKEIKAKIMRELIDVLHDNIVQNESLFDDRAISDMLFSITIMFCRETLSQLLFGNNEKMITLVLSEFYQIIDTEIKSMIKEDKPASKTIN